MLDLAMHAQKARSSSNDISERQNISLSYLEQLFGKLRRAGLVDNIRGPGGGYILAADARNISIAQIITAAEDKPRRHLCAAAKPTATTARPASRTICGKT